MAGSNQFKAFATGAGANVLTPANLAALATLASGFSSGVASSQQLNTLWRQSSFVATAIAQAIADMTGAAVNDDGVIANFENQLLAMLQQMPYSIAAAPGGTSDAITVAFTPAMTAFSAGPIWWRATAANATTTPTLKRDGLVAKTIVKGNGLALAAGDIPGAGAWMCSQYDATLDKEVLFNPATGARPITAPADLTASRAFGASYTNSANHEITVYATTQASAGAAGLTGYLSGVPVAFNYVPNSGVQLSIMLRVPPGVTYQVAVTTGSLTLDKWIEVA